MPSSISPQMAAICSLSMRDLLSLRNPSNILARLSHPFDVIGSTAFALKEREVNIMRDWSAGFAAATRIYLDLYHDDYCVPWILVRGKGRKPGCVCDSMVVGVHNLSRSGLS